LKKLSVNNLLDEVEDRNRGLQEAPTTADVGVVIAADSLFGENFNVLFLP